MNYIYQIVYDEKTLKSHDVGFLLLDNQENLRPDWYEYWPIRRFLENSIMNESSYYGFFSPKFQQKTGLNSSDVYNFIEASDADIISFSPYFDQSAYAINVFEQAEANHAGISKCFKYLFDYLNINENIKETIMPTDSIIFCNYFVAKRHVWQAWADLCDKIFKVSETNDSSLSHALNSPVTYVNAGVSSKVFVIERMISLLISLNASWRVKAYDPYKLPYTQSAVSSFRDELALLAALKLSYSQNKRKSDFEMFFKIRSNIGK